jgi:hypothetical protein
MAERPCHLRVWPCHNKKHAWLDAGVLLLPGTIRFMKSETWISLVAAVCAGVSALIAWIQRLDTIRASKAQAEDNKKTVEAAERSARAAEESASLAKSALEVGRRAWVTVADLSIHEKNVHTAVPLVVHLIIQNGGTTPAVNVTGTFKLFEAQSLAEVPKIPQIDLGTIGPGNLRHQYVQPENNTLASQAVQNDIKNQRLSLYLSALIKYGDTVFGNEHATSALYIYRPQEQNFMPWGGNKFNYTN